VGDADQLLGIRAGPVLEPGAKRIGALVRPAPQLHPALPVAPRASQTASAVRVAIPSSSRRDRVRVGPTPSLDDARTRASPSRFHADLLQVELTLDVPEHVVVDGAPVAHRQHRLALGVEHRAPDLPVLDQLLLGLAARRLVELLDVLRSVTVRSPQLVEQRPMPGPLLVQRVDPAQRLIDEQSPRLLLLGPRGVIAAKVDRPDDPWQGRALADQGHAPR